MALALMAPAAAFASGQLDMPGSYNPQRRAHVVSTTTTVSTPRTTTTSTGTLPFTGLDIVLLAAGGGTLLARPGSRFDGSHAAYDSSQRPLAGPSC